MITLEKIQTLVDKIQGTKAELNLLLLEAWNIGLQTYLRIKDKDISTRAGMRYIHIDCILSIPSTKKEPECL